MTPAERARMIDEEEFRKESERILARALAAADTRRNEERARFAALTPVIERPALIRQQRRNPIATPKHTMIEFDGQNRSVSEWAAHLGISTPALLLRIQKYGPQASIKMGPKMHKARPRTLITANGQTRSIREWADVVGVSSSAIHRRLLRGLNATEAVTMPRQRSPFPGRGVVSDFASFQGTGVGSTAQAIPEITFSEKAN